MHYCRFLPLFFLVVIAGCATSIQGSYWSANTATAIAAEEDGDFEKAETEYLLALKRAKNHLSAEVVSTSHYNLGVFYRQQQRFPEAEGHLLEALQLEETLSGPTSVRTGKRLAELAATYLMQNNFNEARPYVERLRPLEEKYTGEKRRFVQELLKVYEDKPAQYAKELERLRPLVRKGDASAQYQMGIMYEDGRGVPQNYKKAVALYEQAAAQGLVEAECHLGVLYDKGRAGVKCNDKKAVYWYRKAAKQGYAQAQYNLGVMYATGRGVPKDKAAALKWLREASTNNHPSAPNAVRMIEAGHW